MLCSLFLYQDATIPMRTGETTHSKAPSRNRKRKKTPQRPEAECNHNAADQHSIWTPRLQSEAKVSSETSDEREAVVRRESEWGRRRTTWHEGIERQAPTGAFRREGNRGRRPVGGEWSVAAMLRRWRDVP